MAASYEMQPIKGERKTNPAWLPSGKPRKKRGSPVWTATFFSLPS
jgi:hypothetical protein